MDTPAAGSRPRPSQSPSTLDRLPGGQVVDEGRGILPEHGDVRHLFNRHELRRQLLGEGVGGTERARSGVDVDHRHRARSSSDSGAARSVVRPLLEQTSLSLSTRRQISIVDTHEPAHLRDQGLRVRSRATDSSATTVASLQVDSWRRTRARSASRCWRRSSNASEPGGAAASERVAWATMASAMERSPAGLG